MAANALSDVKGKNIVIMDVSEASAFTDYFVIATAESFVQMQALAEKVKEAMGKKGVKAGHREGSKDSAWILLDFNTVVVHLFSQAAREYYALEQLWGDAKIYEWMEDGEMERLNA